MKKFTTSSNPAQRIEFAHNLRGVAALSVVICHLLGVFWLNNAAVVSIANTSIYSGEIPSVVGVVNKFSFFSYGHFGVALFFLISGFVIPFSLCKYSRLQFLTARFFRLYPTYIAGFAISAAILYFSSHYFAKPFPYSKEIVTANALIVRDLFWFPSIDGISWTLEVEIKFYILCALISNFIIKSKIKYILLLAVIFVLFTGATSIIADDLLKSSPAAYRFVYLGQLNFMMITFMLIGTVFNLHIRDSIDFKTLVFSAGFLLAAFGIQWNLSIMKPGAYSGVLNYSLALGVFCFFYMAKNLKFPKPLDMLADISYPFYVVHAMYSYVFMRISLNYVNPYIAILIGFGGSIILAALLHIFIETPSNNLGKFVARKLEGVDIFAKLLTSLKKTRSVSGSTVLPPVAELPSKEV